MLSCPAEMSHPLPVPLLTPPGSPGVPADPPGQCNNSGAGPGPVSQPHPSSGGHCGQSVSVAVVQVVSCTELLAEGVSQGSLCSPHHPPGTELTLPEKRVRSANSHQGPMRPSCSPTLGSPQGSWEGGPGEDGKPRGGGRQHWGGQRRARGWRRAR